MKRFICSAALILMFASGAYAYGLMWIAGCGYDNPYYLDDDCSGTGWSWNTESSTLTLDSSYTGEPVFINSYTKLEIVGDVTINGGEVGVPLRCNGDLEITGSGRLHLVPSLRGREYSLATLQASGTITFSGAEVITSAEGELNSAICSEYGDIILKNSAQVTADAKGTQGIAVYSAGNVELYGSSNLKASGEGTDSSGIYIKDGILDVEDDASLTAKGSGKGYAVKFVDGDMLVFNDNVKLIADNKTYASNRDNEESGIITIEDIQNVQAPYSSAYNGLDPVYSNDGFIGTADKVKITAPKLTKNQFTAGSATDQTFNFTITGAMPEASVYIPASEAKKLWPSLYSGKDNVLLTRENIAKYHIPFRVTSCSIESGDTAGTNNTVTVAFNGANVSLKNFPITVSAKNNNTKMKKAVTKSVKVSVNDSVTPVWQYPSEGGSYASWDKKTKQEITVTVNKDSSSGIPSTIYCVSPATPGPYTITAKGSKNGVEAIVKQPLFDDLGNVTEPGSVRITGTLTNTTKESRIPLTLTAANTSTKKKASVKVTVSSKIAPYFEAKQLVSGSVYLARIKTAVKGKVPNVKAAAKGSKPITYSVSSEDEEALAKFGLRINRTKGSLEAVKRGQTKITQEGGRFTSLDIAITANNSVGSASVRALVGITAPKPKFITKTITVLAGARRTGEVVGTVQVKGIDASTPSEDASVRYALKKGTLPGGLAFRNYDELDDGAEYRNMYALVVTDAAALASAAELKANRKGVSVTVTASDYGVEADGKVTIKLAQGITNGDIEDNTEDINTTSNVENTHNERSTYSVHGREVHNDEDMRDGIIFGTPRTEASITSQQRALIEREGYIIAAVLPELQVTESGQYDIENIKLYDHVPEGAVLIWLAFPDEASEDEDIAEFYDENGAEIERVPAGRKVTVSPWLNAGVKYKPIIAAEK